MSKKNHVVLHTTAGEIKIELMPEVAPKATENFLTHAKNGYYDNLTFHRVIPKFMIQGGDPTGTGAGGESIWGHSFEDEFSSDVNFDEEGILAMANSGPHTNGSQFFITTAPTPWLNQRHTIFGKVVGGIENLKKIEKVPTDASDRPTKVQKILKITRDD